MNVHVSSGRRHALLAQARDIHPSLGDLWQNPIELTPKDTQQELARIINIQQALKAYATAVAKAGPV